MFSSTTPVTTARKSPLGVGLSLGLALAVGLLPGAPARADNDDGYYDRDAGAYDADAYQERREGAEFDYAQVLNVEPNLHQVRVTVPHQECYAETRYVPDGDGDYRRDRPSAGPMILGGLIGAVVGHQFDYGRSRGAGTVVGAVIGSAVGHDAAQRQDADRDYGYRGPVRAVDSQRCETRYDEHYESRIESYRVSYRYRGRIYHTTLPEDPGQQLRVRVAVTPEG